MSSHEPNADTRSEDVSFEGLAASRRDWIQLTLRTWCRRASQRELRKAEPEWLDIAGKVDVKATLWTWAWERFPDLVHPEMPGVHETFEVRVVLRDGRVLTGFPDNRESVRGTLLVVGFDQESGKLIQQGPVSIDDIDTVSRVPEKPSDSQ